MRHVPASWLESCDVFCRLKVCSTEMVTDMPVQKEKYQLCVKYTAGFNCKAIGLIQDGKHHLELTLIIFLCWKRIKGEINRSVLNLQKVKGWK